MEQKQRLFIYGRKEMAVLILLGVMVALFAFTLGVHLGKRVMGKGALHAIGEHAPVGTISDQVPSKPELKDQARGAQQASDEAIQKAVHDEVAKTGLKLDNPKTLELPKETKTKNAGATSPPVTAPILKALPHETKTAEVA